MTQEETAKAETTKAALIRAGLELFGRNGFDATSTRQIAAKAGANISAISYYFGGKENLRLACAEHVAEKMAAVSQMALTAPDGIGPQEAAEMLGQIFSGMLQALLLQPDGERISQFILREITQPGPVLDAVYPRFVEPVHQSLCRLWASATGKDAQSEDVKLGVFSAIGQVVYFRIARELVSRRMDWGDPGPDQVADINTVVQNNLRAILRTDSKRN
ncbi:MAG TPA: DUF1956 domain-containing protein [Rhodobacteraceae bacterium]|nr:DUF1956 domain-containing protein [Paracoccaceae bacterium]